MIDKNTKIYVNPTGRFVVGGPHGDAGVTGRKIIVDTYGGAAPHGGGAFSGKDPTKVDRSACYMARYIAKNVVAAGLAERALVQLAYAIGVADPVSVMVHTEGTGRVPETQITELVRGHFKLTPRGIMEELDLAAADLPEDGRVRPLRPHRAGVHLGTDRQGGRPPCRGATLAAASVKRVALATAALLAAVAVWIALSLPPARIALPPPAADAAATVPGVFHVHTNRSDGRSSPEEIAAAAARAGLKFVIFTDHGDGTAKPAAPAYHDGVLCIDGVEVSTRGGHYIARRPAGLAVPARRRSPRRHRGCQAAGRIRHGRAP